MNSSRIWALYCWSLGAIFIGLAVTQLLAASDRAIVWNTLGLGVAASCIAIPLGVSTCKIFEFNSIASKALAISIAGLLGMPLILQASSWDSAFGRLGWLTAQRGEVLQPLLSGWAAAVWIHGLAAVPQVALIVLIGQSTSKRTFEEQASLDASGWSVFWRVSLPQLLPVILIACSWTVLTCARTIAVSDIFRIGTLAEQIYLGFSLGQLSAAGAWTSEQIQYAENLGIWVTVLTIGWLALGAFWIFSSLLNAQTRLSSTERIAKSFFYRPGTWAVRLAAVAMLGLLLIVPVANLGLRASFQVVNLDGTPTPTYLFANVVSSLQRAATTEQGTFVWSTLIAACSSFLILVVAATSSWFARNHRIVRLAVLLSFLLTFSIPGPLLGNQLAFLFGNLEGEFFNWLYNYTIFAPVIANSLFCWPLGGLLVWLTVNMEQDVADNASLDGAGHFQQFWQFGIVQHWKPLMGVWLILFAICFGELSASRMVLPAGIQTIPGVVLGFMHAGVDEMTAGLTIITSIGLILISLTGWTILVAGTKPARK